MNARRLVWVLALLTGVGAIAAPTPPTHVQFVFTSDAHYGLTRANFQTRRHVSAHAVNAAMVAQINTLPGTRFPPDLGLRGGMAVGPIDFVAEGGDIANREESEGDRPIQSAATSWSQFRTDYLEGLRVRNPAGRTSPVYVVPGNHDASNAVGFYKPMRPPTDATAMAEIFNGMLRPATLRTPDTYRYDTDQVLYSRDLGGVHFVFITLWPDSRVRAWMDRDLTDISAATPVVVFAHDQPDVEAKHFTNPNGNHGVNDRDRFENLLSDEFADGPTIDVPSVIEQRAFEAFLRRHANITAYFHGNSNWNEFYDWRGPGGSVVLHTFRVDSPMKGKYSSRDERQLSFLVATLDEASHTMTVRECLWNKDPRTPSAAIGWGASVTVALAPRAVPTR